MDGQPRHQHRPLTTASHHTIARRPPTPLEAHRARTQRQLKAFLPQSHPTKGLHTDELPIELIESQRHHNYPLQLPREHLKRRRSGGSRYRKQIHDVKIQHIIREGAEMSQDRKGGCYLQPTRRRKTLRRRKMRNKDAISSKGAYSTLQRVAANGGWGRWGVSLGDF